MLIVPASICVVSNTLIYLHVRSSSGRVQTQSVANQRHRSNVNRRDIFLLRHMIILFCLFMCGWGPTVIVDVVIYKTGGGELAFDCATINFQLALLLDIVDLFLYNHAVRKYVTGFCFQFFRRR